MSLILSKKHDLYTRGAYHIMIVRTDCTWNSTLRHVDVVMINASLFLIRYMIHFVYISPPISTETT